MAELQNVDIYSSVTLVDRIGQGGAAAEFIYDGIRFPFVDEDGAAVTELTVPQFVAEFVFKTEKYRVWTTPTATRPQDFVNRYGIKACPRKLTELWGPEVAECGRIEPDLTVIEGTDVARERVGPVVVEPVNIPPAERPGRDRQGRHAAISTQERG